MRGSAIGRRIDETIYMFYTAVDGANAPRVAITSLSRKDFLSHAWNRWARPKLISPPGIDDKDACVFPEKIRGKYVVLHRIQPSIDINFFDDLEFSEGTMLSQSPFMLPRQGMWDDQKIGLNTVPIRTDGVGFSSIMACRARVPFTVWARHCLILIIQRRANIAE